MYTTIVFNRAATYIKNNYNYICDFKNQKCDKQDWPTDIGKIAQIAL